MRKVERSEIVDYETWSDRREGERAAILEIKRPRRIHLGDELTFLFENTDTMRYQIQEMMRVERIVREAAICHEIDTYNEILGGDGELGCTLLIEIEDPDDRQAKLTAWVDLPRHLYARLEDGTKVRPRFDEAQVGRGRLSSVQYLKFDTGGRVPVALGSDLAILELETRLTEPERSALATDLAAR